MKNAAGDLPRRVVFYVGSLRERECRVKFYFVIRTVVRTRVTTPSSIQRVASARLKFAAGLRSRYSAMVEPRTPESKTTNVMNGIAAYK